MPESSIWTLRKTPSRLNQVGRIERATGLHGFGAIIDYALARVVSSLPTEPHEADAGTTDETEPQP